MLGSQLVLDVPERLEVLGTDVAGGPGVHAPGCDLTDAAAVRRLFRQAGPFSGVLHAAAYTAVDKAESEPELAERVNALACANLAAAAAGEEIPLVVVSTDFVFDGSARTPYAEDAPPRPLGVYGRTKLAGEERAREAYPDGVRIVRTQWLYGPRGAHFPGTILRLARERERLKVVNDQIGSPTSTLELSPALWDVLERGQAGVYHAACTGTASWYDFASATLELAGVGTPIDPCTTAEFPRPAPRPAYSVLACERLTALRGRPLAPWRAALETFLRQEGLLAAPPGAQSQSSGD